MSATLCTKAKVAPVVGGKGSHPSHASRSRSYSARHGSAVVNNPVSPAQPRSGWCPTPAPHVRVRAGALQPDARQQGQRRRRRRPAFRSQAHDLFKLPSRRPGQGPSPRQSCHRCKRSVQASRQIAARCSQYARCKCKILHGILLLRRQGKGWRDVR